MKRLASCALAPALILAQSSCTFDLTEVEPEVRNPRLSAVVETNRGSATYVVVHLDPGTTDQGVARSLAYDYVTVDGAAYQPTHRLANGIRTYEISGVPESRALVNIVAPPIEGVGTIPTLVVARLGVAAADTIAPLAGVLEIPIVAMADGIPWTRFRWNAVLYVAGTAEQQMSLTGTHPLPSILRVPVIHLPGDLRAGHIEVSAVSDYSSEPGAVVRIAVQRTMRASVPFRIPEGTASTAGRLTVR